LRFGSNNLDNGDAWATFFEPRSGGGLERAGPPSGPVLRKQS
jgi:hypothetical protein